MRLWSASETPLSQDTRHGASYQCFLQGPAAPPTNAPRRLKPLKPGSRTLSPLPAEQCSFGTLSILKLVIVEVSAPRRNISGTRGKVHDSCSIWSPDLQPSQHTIPNKHASRDRSHSETGTQRKAFAQPKGPVVHDRRMLRFSSYSNGRDRCRHSDPIGWSYTRMSTPCCTSRDPPLGQNNGNCSWELTYRALYSLLPRPIREVKTIELSAAVATAITHIMQTLRGNRGLSIRVAIPPRYVD